MASALALLYAKLSAKVLAVTSLSFLMAQMDQPLNSVSELKKVRTDGTSKKTIKYS